jgi:hypothetical protein
VTTRLGGKGENDRGSRSDVFGDSAPLGASLGAAQRNSTFSPISPHNGHFLLLDDYACAEAAEEGRRNAS